MLSVMSVLLSIFLILVSGCGVETDSSKSVITDSTVGTDTNATDANTTDANATDTNSTGSGGVIVIDSSTEGFDKSDAGFDSLACTVDDVYSAISDTSLDPLSSIDPVNGIEINSDLRFTSDAAGTTIAIFYPDLTQSLTGQFVNVFTDQDYRFAFDKAWLSNTNKTVYIRTPGVDGGVFSCYRFVLTSLDAGAITSTKVYR